MIGDTMKIIKKIKIILSRLISISVIFFISFYLITTFFIRNINTSDFIKMVFDSSTNYIKKSNKKMFNSIIKTVSKIDITNPVTIINSKYIDDDIDRDVPESNYIKDPNSFIVKDPIVYLYNTHQTEEYTNSSTNTYNVAPTVMLTSYILKEALNKEGISTIVEENDVTSVLRSNNWKYAASYKVTRMLLDDAKEKNPSLVYFIDLHRDSVNKKISTKVIDNKSYARILFILGLENPNYKENQVMIEKLNNSFNEKYPGLSRGIYKKQGAGVNGVYNQDFDKNTILIEVGGEENTIDEVYNTCQAIKEILVEYIKEDYNE